MEFDFIRGELLLIDKAIDWTSFDAVNKVRRLISRQLGKKLKVGHAGTLDPKATGLLLICTGAMTKRINELVGLDKEYAGTFLLGATTPSYDSETEINHKSETGHLTSEMILAATQKFIGTIQQVPPQFSAKLVEGKRAYLSARKNKEVKIEPVTITIKEFEITRIDLPEVSFRVVCSKGTYIRSLARDFGEALNSGAYLTSLRRTGIGRYSVQDALTVAQFEALLYLE
ncbi:MAG: tRNA pseudouridine(55) synthase TruB [Bacteroidales bacterium]|nr:tRNA pseudouridine(55) synthase TruB [Bacteroidales bacterium]